MSDEQQPQPPPVTAATVQVVKRKRGRPRKPTTAATMPAGHARDEALKAQADVLEQTAEQRAEQLGKEAINPRSFRVIPELQSQLSSVMVTNALPDKVYAWVYAPAHSTPAASIMVQEKLSQTVFDDTNTPCPTWEVVNKADATMPEALERKDVMNYRRIGDVILMRCDRAKHKALEDHQKYKAERALASSTDALNGLAEKYGIKTYDNLNDSPVLRSAMGQRLASEKFDRAIRDGSVPGMPATGR